MPGPLRKTVALFFLLTSAATPSLLASDVPASPLQILISVQDQRLALVRDGELVARFPVSTSRFGVGDNFGSYRTPLGELRICDKIGDNLAPGSVIHHRAATGEVLPVNAPGRDPIVTRVIWLDGTEAQNENAHARGIYIHGTPEERTIGTPVSWGCIRMRSKDVIQVFNQVPVGTVVSIVSSRLPHMHRYEPPRETPTPEPSAEPNTALAKATAPPEPRKPQPDKPAPEKSPSDKVLLAKAKDSLPPIAEPPAHSSSSALHDMKGSILLANLPGSVSEKTHAEKATQ